MTYTMDFLQSPEAAAARMAERRPAWVAIVEPEEGQFQELDADDRDHAVRLGVSWLKRGSLSAQVARVFPDGALGARHYIGGVVRAG